MIISCQNENDAPPCTASLIDKLKQLHIEIKDESISLCDMFRKINIPINVKYIFNFNPNVFISFSGTVNDLLTHLHKVNNIHTDIALINDQIIMSFDECNITKKYNIDGSAIKTDDIITNIIKITNNANNVIKISNRIINVTTSCENHNRIQLIIDQYNKINNICIEIELTTIDIYATAGSDNNCIDFIRAAIHTANSGNKTPSFAKLTDDISKWLNKNGKGKCELTSNTFCTVFNNSSIKINTGIDNTADKFVDKKIHNINHQKEKSYTHVEINAECHDTKHANLIFNIKRKCELGGQKASVSESVIAAKIPSGQIFYLLDRDGGGIESKESFISSEDQQYKGRTVVLAKATIKQGDKK
jgi:hypothetical protein